MGLLDFFSGASPQVAAGEAAGAAAGKVLGSIGDLAVKIREAIKGKEMDPAVAAHLSEIAMQAEQAQLQGQLAINLEDAKQGKFFQSGWRPFIGWICGCAIGYTYLVQPFLMFAVQIEYWRVHAPAGTPFPVLPTLSMQDILGLVFALLGMATLRSVDKRAGVA